MMRLPVLSHFTPKTLDEAIALASELPSARFVAGGTDLLPKLKRRQLGASALISLTRCEELQTIKRLDDGGWRIGAGVKLVELVRLPELRSSHPAIWQAASQVASPPIRSSGTVGGNLCVDPRCFWFDQTAPWREAAGQCMKIDPAVVCRVAPNSPRCWAVSSTDLAPAMGAARAKVRIVGPAGERTVPLPELYRDDGIDYMTLSHGEVIVDVEIPGSVGWRSAFWKIRRRQSIDFALLSASVEVFMLTDEVLEARVGLGAVGSCPLFPPEVAAVLVGTKLEDDVIEAAAAAAKKLARPMETSDMPSSWRRRVLPVAVKWALREVRGDDVTDARRRYGPQVLLP
ncbi:MAG: FAD binding domain-containing protein [Deltaproteobacteria bacterium]|nr:FAD binding domain-containing protein [Deltaproteobacteria bacterium]